MSDGNVSGSCQSDPSAEPNEPTAETRRGSPTRRDLTLEGIETGAHATATPSPSTDSSGIRVPSPVSLVGSLAGLDEATKKTLRRIFQFAIIFLSCATGLGIIINAILKQVL